MSLPVYNARRRRGELQIWNSNFENHPVLSGGSRAVGSWVNGVAAGSQTNDLFGWYFQNTGAGVMYFDATTSKWGGTAITLAIPDVNAAANPSFSNWDGSNIRKYGIGIRPNVSHTGFAIYKTSYIAGTLTPNVGARAYFEERDVSGALIATHYTTFVNGNTAFDERSTTFTTDSSACWMTVGGQIFALDGNNNLQMYSWFSKIGVIDNGIAGIARDTANRIPAPDRTAVGM